MADVSIYGYRSSTTYNYRICQNYLLNLLPEDHQTLVVEELKKGVGSWKDATYNYLLGEGTLKPTCSLFDIDFDFLQGERANYIILLPLSALMKYCDFADRLLGCSKNAPNTNEVFADTNIAIYDIFAKKLRCFQFDKECQKDKERDEQKGCSHLSRIAMHEAGHAYGLHHATVAEISVMYTIKDNRCQPTEFDVVAIKTNYQSR